ncbi:MAG: type II toxin-antitoxin system MqsR family toxin [Coriobacteriales bacterium]|jgi:hypothetical protein
MARPRGPEYDLEEVKRLAAAEKLKLSMRVDCYLRNHGYGIPMECAMDVIASLDESCFYKTIMLEKRDGKPADVYRGVECLDETWYVKLFVDSDGDAVVQVWSMKEDGYAF